MPPEFDRTEVSGTSATIVWKHIPNRSDIAHFELELEQVSKTTIKSFKTKEGIVNSYTFNDLEDGDKGSVYIVRVRAVLGDGEKSDWMTKTISMKHGKICVDNFLNIINKPLILNLFYLNIWNSITGLFFFLPPNLLIDIYFSSWI